MSKIINGMNPKTKYLWCKIIWPEANTIIMIAYILQQPQMHEMPCLGKIDDNTKNFTKTSKSWEKTSPQWLSPVIMDLQSSLAQALVTSRRPLVLCSSLNKGQTIIQTVFDWAMSSEIHRSNDAQLEMALTDFFHYENIADCLVESTWFQCMSRQAQLMGGKFRPPTRK